MLSLAFVFRMVVSKIVEAIRFSAETAKGAALVLARPNEPIPATKLHPRMPAWPQTTPEWVSARLF